MNANIIRSVDPNRNQYLETVQINREITETTSKSDFEKLCSRFPHFTLDCGGVCADTVLATAVIKGNIPLIEEIAKKGMKLIKELTSDSVNPLFLIRDTLRGFTPLHLASTCEDKEKGYLAAKTLVKMGSPVNIAQYIDSPNLSGFFVTPLDTALEEENIKIATFLLRQGGIALWYDGENLAIAKKDIMEENEMLFKLSQQNNFPKEIMNYILYLSTKLISSDPVV